MYLQFDRMIPKAELAAAHHTGIVADRSHGMNGEWHAVLARTFGSVGPRASSRRISHDTANAIEVGIVAGQVRESEMPHQRNDQCIAAEHPVLLDHNRRGGDNRGRKSVQLCPNVGCGPK
jgi:hypothetical protein